MDGRSAKGQRQGSKAILNCRRGRSFMYFRLSINWGVLCSFNVQLSLSCQTVLSFALYFFSWIASVFLCCITDLLFGSDNKYTMPVCSSLWFILEFPLLINWCLLHSTSYLCILNIGLGLASKLTHVLHSHSKLLEKELKEKMLFLFQRVRIWESSTAENGNNNCQGCDLWKLLYPNYTTNLTPFWPPIQA